MTTKEWLNQGKYLNREIRALKDALDKAENLHDICHDNNNNKYISNLHGKISQLAKTNSDILSAIYKVEDNILRTLLIERYINNKTWEKISIILGYDFYHVIKRLYPKAVKEVEKILYKDKSSHSQNLS